MAKETSSGKVIGLELFNSELRAVELSGSVAKPRISAWGSVVLPDGTVNGGMIAKPEVFMQYLRNMMTANRFKAKNFVIELSSAITIMRIAGFPKVTPDRQENVIRLSAQDFIPVPLAELELGYVVLGEEEGVDGATELTTLLVAARSLALNSLIDTIQNPKYGSFIVSDVLLGIASLANEAERSTTARSYMLMHINRDSISILIIRDKKIAMARSVQFEASISDALNRSAAGDIPGDIAREVLETLAGEYRASVGYYSDRGNDIIDEAYIYSQSIDISENIAEFTSIAGIETKLLTPDKRFCSDPEFPAHKYLGCISIAVSKLPPK